MSGTIVTVETIDEIINTNPVLRQVKAMYRENGEQHKIEVLRQQTAKGIEKYGHAVDYTAKTAEEWEQYRLEEVIDGDVYAICKIMREHHDWQQEEVQRK